LEESIIMSEDKKKSQKTIDTKLPETCKQVVLKQNANGIATKDNFEVQTVNLPVLRNHGEVLVHTLYLSVDPYIRGMIGTDPEKSLTTTLKPGEVIVGMTIGEIVESRNPKLLIGDIVRADSGWKEYYVLPGRDVTKINNNIGLPLEKYLSILGMPGLTAFHGLIHVAEIKQREHVVVSAGAGAVGSIVGQIAKIYGCRVVGIAGGKTKCKYMKAELGYDEVIDYKEEKDLNKALLKHLPHGVDIYYDNVGGEISDAVIPHINRKARIVIGGQMSTYNVSKDKELTGPRLLHHLLWKSAKMQGFLYSDFEEHHEKALKQLRAWIAEDRLESKEDVVEGIDHAPDAFVKLFKCESFGKQVVKVGDQLTKEVS